jgi:hypothetical protein
MRKASSVQWRIDLITIHATRTTVGSFTAVSDCPEPHRPEFFMKPDVCRFSAKGVVQYCAAFAADPGSFHAGFSSVSAIIHNRAGLLTAITTRTPERETPKCREEQRIRIGPEKLGVLFSCVTSRNRGRWHLCNGRRELRYAAFVFGNQSRQHTDDVIPSDDDPHGRRF